MNDDQQHIAATSGVVLSVSSTLPPELHNGGCNAYSLLYCKGY